MTCPDAFRPHIPPCSDGIRKAEALRISYGEGAHRFGDLRLPNGLGPHPVVVLIHGGAWRTIYHLDLMDLLANDLAAHGFATWNLEYRRVGHPGGGWPGTFHDVANGMDILRTLAGPHHLDLGRVIALGHSAGGHLALWLAVRRRLPPGSALETGAQPLPLRGVVMQAGIADLRRFWQEGGEGYHEVISGLLDARPEERPDRWREASPAAWLPLGIPQVLVHGSADQAVPVSLSREYAAAARAAGDVVDLLELPGVEHFAVLYPELDPWKPTFAAIRELARS